jgi:hypothetical protein
MFYSLVSHQRKLADFTSETNKNGNEYSFLREYFQKEPNINGGLRLAWEYL